MKFLAVFVLASLAGAIAVRPVSAHDCGCRHGCDRYDHWYGDDCPGCDHDGGRCWNGHHPARAQQYETTEGKVSEINYLPAADPASSVLELRLSTGTAGVLVRLGPSSFLKRNNFDVREGDTLSVHGFRASTSEGEVLVATAVEKSGHRLVLRDDWGRPAWW